MFYSNGLFMERFSDLKKPLCFVTSSLRQKCNMWNGLNSERWQKASLWLAPSPHSEKGLSSMDGCLCGASRFSLCLNEAPPVYLSTQNMHNSSTHPQSLLQFPFILPTDFAKKCSSKGFKGKTEADQLHVETTDHSADILKKRKCKVFKQYKCFQNFMVHQVLVKSIIKLLQSWVTTKIIQKSSNKI